MNFIAAKFKVENQFFHPSPKGSESIFPAFGNCWRGVNMENEFAN